MVTKRTLELAVEALAAVVREEFGDDEPLSEVAFYHAPGLSQGHIEALKAVEQLKVSARA